MSPRIFVYPTDTAYALGCAYTDTKAIRTIMRIKGRTDAKFTVIASSLRQVEHWFKLTATQRRLARKYWPGPLSIVVSKKYAIRVPNNAVARSLARRVKTPLLATSLNLHGRPPAYDLNHVAARLIARLRENNVHIIDIGPLPHNKPSTVVECKGNELIIHRHGPIIPS